ncbi:MAG TPA: protein-L-isoaspartate(D-aspartate) O-methyltransferase [Saprospiraceae bacterium]|nr:protein-L-isoaspartate(D-aspartate) O-methyltransferase [Saprospiraceae bacterium]
MKDNYRLKGLRKRLIKTLREEGIRDERILKAFEHVPRHYFMDSAFADAAYENKAFPIGKGQTISQPYTVAFQTELLQVKKNDKVLEIGTGSGFQAAILAEIGARVFTVERQEELYLKAKDLLADLGYDQVYCFYQDGNLGLPELAPFDRIIFTAGCSEFPEKLLGQLNLNGIAIIPVGEKVQTMYRITRTGLNEYKKETFGQFRFVPFLKGVMG